MYMKIQAQCTWKYKLSVHENTNWTCTLKYKLSVHENTSLVYMKIQAQCTWKYEFSVREITSLVYNYVKASSVYNYVKASSVYDYLTIRAYIVYDYVQYKLSKWNKKREGEKREERKPWVQRFQCIQDTSNLCIQI